MPGIIIPGILFYTQIFLIYKISSYPKSGSRPAGVTRTNLYQSLSENGRHAFETVAKVARYLGYRIALVNETATAH